MAGTAVRAYVSANRQRMWGWVADAISVWGGLTGWTVRQLETVIDTFSWGLRVRSALQGRACFSGGQERHWEGRVGGWMGRGMRTWKYKKVKLMSTCERTSCSMKIHILILQDTKEEGSSATQALISFDC